MIDFNDGMYVEKKYMEKLKSLQRGILGKLKRCRTLLQKGKI